MFIVVRARSLSRRVTSRLSVELTYFDNSLSSNASDSCTNCRDIFLSLLAHQKMGTAQTQHLSPVQSSPKRYSGGPLSPNAIKRSYSSKEQMAAMELASIKEERSPISKAFQQSLSVAHPRPTPIDTLSTQNDNSRKLSRKSETEVFEDLASPDALYFGKRSRRTYGHASRTSISVEPSFLNLKTSSRIQRVQDAEMSP